MMPLVLNLRKNIAVFLTKANILTIHHANQGLNSSNKESKTIR